MRKAFDMLSLIISVVLASSSFPFGSTSTSCSYPDQWSTEGLAFPPVRYFTNIPACENSTIFVDHPSKTMQIRSFTSGKETGRWVYKDGLEGASINIPLFGRGHVNHADGKCDVMTFRTRDNKPMAGAIEMHQHLTDLKPILAGDGSVLYYEKNFTSQQVLEQSMQLSVRNNVGIASNYLYSTFIHRVKINDKGQCVPLSFLRVVFFGSSCFLSLNLAIRNNLVPTLVEYFYAADEKAYRPGEIGRFDRSIPKLSCSNRFEGLDEAEKKVTEAYETGKCAKSELWKFYYRTCCTMDYKDYLKSPQCDISKYNLFQQFEQVWSTICRKREAFERGTAKIRHRDEKCFANHKEFKIW